MSSGEPVKDAGEIIGIEFDDDFIRLEASIHTYDSEGSGPLVQGKEAFQWSTVESECGKLLAKAKDLRVAIWYLRACLSLRALPGLREGMVCLANILRLPLDQIHPYPSEDESPRECHALQLGWLCGEQFAHQFATARIAADSSITVRDLAINKLADLSGKVADTRECVLSDLKGILDDFKAIGELLSSESMNFDVSRVCEIATQAMFSLRPKVVPSSVDSADSSIKAMEAMPQSQSPAVAASAHVPGVISGREDVSNTLDHLIEYFKNNEPGHPAPIFLARVKSMVGANFEDLMAELYPEADTLVARIGRPHPPA